MRQPWPLDGITEFSRNDEAPSQIIKTGMIDSYLSVGDHDDKFFLIGSKGLGKTTLLSYKSHLYREQHAGSYKYSPFTNELTEKLVIETNTFSQDEIFRFRHITDWETLWKLTLWILCFKYSGLEINPEVERLINGKSRLGTIFSELLSNRGKISMFPRFINEFIDRSNQIQSGVAIFIDDVDQAFEQSILNNEHYSDYYNAGHVKPVVEIWINGQNALISAIYSIYRQNRHIKIFATIRAEAFHCIKAQQKPNYGHHVVQLIYGKLDIKDIFIKNIELIPKDALVFKTGKTPLEKFLGFDTNMKHRFAVDYQNNPREESAFDFLFRHTYERPREIVMMGRKLHELVTQKTYRDLPLREKMEQVRAKITLFADTLFDDYKKQIIPEFDSQKFMQFIHSIRGNCIPKEVLKGLDPSTISLYYNLGLLGYVKEEPLGGKVGTYLPAAEYNYSELIEIPEASYYITHPTMDEALLKPLTYVGFYYKHAIIGNGYKFYDPQEDVPKEPEHYIPALFPGHNGEVAVDHHAHGIRRYYNFFFLENNPATFLKEYVNLIDQAQRALTKLARVCYFYKLNKEFKGEYQDRIDALREELRAFALERPYAAAMNEEEILYSKNKFMTKLFGRFIALGSILFLDMNTHAIKHLLQHKEVNFKAEEDPDTVYQFLKRNFFIPKLGRSRSLSNDHCNHNHRMKKNAIFNSLSDYEKDSLMILRNTVIEEVDMTADDFRNIEHLEWVKTQVMDKIWNGDLPA